jgi:hypothetical protein
MNQAKEGNPAKENKMKTVIILILMLLPPLFASAEELVYDQNWNLKYRPNL